jgi:hypothetical protein
MSDPKWQDVQIAATELVQHGLIYECTLDLLTERAKREQLQREYKEARQRTTTAQEAAEQQRLILDRLCKPGSVA